MPLDGILVGTAAMATLEATTAPEVKQLLVDTPGTPDWVGAGTAVGGMASGRSQLGADIHEIDNAASRTGRLLDEVAGDADAVAARRDEIIEALNGTAKPYFGDVATMTYDQWLQRYVEVSIGGGESHRGTATSLWLDITWRDRFASRCCSAPRRACTRPTGARSPRCSPTRPCSRTRPRPSPPCASTYPGADTALLHPADVPFFIALCRTPGKPVNFVPVVDEDVRRWWRSDSLWQAHDPRYSADQVCVIPGTVAVAGITGSTSRSASCSTASRRPPPTRCSPPESTPRASRRRRRRRRRRGSGRHRARRARRHLGRPPHQEPGRAPRRRSPSGPSTAPRAEHAEPGRDADPAR